MIKTNQQSLIFPDYVAASVLELRPEELRRAGITHLVLDVDETLVPRQHNRLASKYVAFLEHLDTLGFHLLVGSNARRDLSEIVQHFHAQVVPTSTSFKPLQSYFHRAIAVAGTDAAHMAMVGDRWLNDVVGGNLAGLTTIMVEPYARRQRLHHRWYLRRALRNSS